MSIETDTRGGGGRSGVLPPVAYDNEDWRGYGQLDFGRVQRWIDSRLVRAVVYGVMDFQRPPQLGQDQHILRLGHMAMAPPVPYRTTLFGDS